MTPAQAAALPADERAAALVRYLSAEAGFDTADEPLGLLGAFALARLLRPAIAIGGAKALANGLFRAGARAGAQYRPVADVQRIEPRGTGGNGSGRMRVSCRDRRTFAAESVVCTLDPRATFLELLDAAVVPGELREAAQRWRTDACGRFTAHFGIKGAPPRVAGADAGEALTQVLGFAGAEAVSDHLEAVAGGRLPASPAGQLTVTTRHDATQAAPGPYGPLHTLRFTTPAPSAEPDGGWDRSRAGYRARCRELIARETRGLESTRELFAFADTPRDLERRFRTTRGGSIRQGSLARAQSFAGRPHPECATGRTPIEGLYLAGGAVHPGIPGTLAGGYNAARVLCEELHVERWWTDPPLVQAARDAGLLPEPALIH